MLQLTALHASAASAGEAIGWRFEPQVVAPLLAVLAVYLAGLARLHQRLGRGRQRHARQVRRFLPGWLLLAGAVVSPLHEGGQVSFTLHMIEHELIMLPAAMLLVAGHPGATLMWGLPPFLRRMLLPVVRASIWKAASSPIAATAIQAAVLVLWHAPRLFDRALRSESWHLFQHASFTASALLFWWAILAETRPGGRLPIAVLCLFATSLIGGGLGALMAFSGSPWYAPYAEMGMTPLGFTPDEDQQLAGLIMWVPGGMFHALAALALLARLLRQPQKFSMKA